MGSALFNSYLKNVKANLMRKICPKVNKQTMCIGVCPDCQKKKIFDTILARANGDDMFEPVTFQDDDEDEELSLENPVPPIAVVAKQLFGGEEEDRNVDPAERERRVQLKIQEYTKKPPVFRISQRIHEEEINTRGIYGRTRLHQAVLDGDQLTVQTLLDDGADHTLKDSSGNTPYRLAVIEQKAPILEMFHDRGIET